MNLPSKLVFARLSTGTKMLLILSAAMLPLGFIALITSLDLARTAKAEREVAAQTTSALYAARIDAVLDRGFYLARAAVVSKQEPADLCVTLGRQARLNRAANPPVAMFDRARRKICQSHGAPIDRLATADPHFNHVWLDPEHRTFRFTSARADGSLYAEAELPVAAIALGIDQQGVPPATIVLRQGAAEIILLDQEKRGEVETIRLSLPLADGRLALMTEYRIAPGQARTILLILLPILMWGVAAVTGWLIVNRLLLFPLEELKRSIDTWQGARGTFNLPRLTTPSHEIRDLAGSFQAVSSRIHAHERELEEGLARQTKLTREVHHRVKNNLQVVSSLINLHARGAEGAVADAYGAIQRRVDALAVVHRNHFAELEDNRGVSMRALAGELASSLRASAPPTASGMPIALNIIDVNVTQDVAVPVAFLITEVVELLMHCNPNGSVLVSLEATDEPDRANLRVETVGMAEAALDDYLGIVRFQRVITGIARQFRSTLIQDLDAGRFEIRISILS